MRQSSFQQRAQAAEVHLVVRRPRTPLRIDRDLSELVAAQAQQHMTALGQGHGGAKKPDRNGQGAVEQSTTEDRPSPRECGGLGAAASEIASVTTTANPSMRPASRGCAGDIGVGLHATHEARVKPPHSPPHRHRHHHPFKRGSPNQARKNTHACQGHRAKGREPTETQRLSGDLRILADATARPPARDGSARRDRKGLSQTQAMSESMVADFPCSQGDQSGPQYRRNSGACRKSSLIMDRPWRLPTEDKATNAEVKRQNRRDKLRRDLLNSNIIVGLNADDEKSPIGSPHTDIARTGASSSPTKDHHPKNLWKVSVDLKIPLDVLKPAYNMFAAYATTQDGATVHHNSQQDVLDMFLTRDAFATVLMAFTGAATVEEIPRELHYKSFADIDKDGDENIDFLEFAEWYFRHGFSEEVLLTKEQREIRDIARKFNIAETEEIERMKRMFVEFDLDASGMIEYDEFEKLLHQMLKVPPHLELPASRVKQFWNDADMDDSGEINFEEFLIFYAKFFSAEGKDNASPLESFYRRLRPNASPGIIPISSPNMRGEEKMVIAGPAPKPSGARRSVAPRSSLFPAVNLRV